MNPGRTGESNRHDECTIEAVVFDLDGVLVDTEPTWEQVRREFVDQAGGAWLPEAQSRLMGMSTPEWALYLRQHLGVDLPAEQIAANVVDRMATSYTRELVLMPEADATLRRLSKRWPLALASSSPRQLIDIVLAKAQWTQLFHATISTEEVARGKPAPDVYLAAARSLGSAPHACVAVEDSTNGLRSAQAAGLRVVAVPRLGYPPAAGALGDADLALDSLSQLSIVGVQSLGGHRT